MAEHFLLSLSLSLIITEGFCARRVNIGNSTLQTLHSEGKFLEIKLFLTYSLLSTFCLKFVQVFFTWYLTISRKNPLISICEYFCSKCHYGHYKTRVSRHSGCWLLLSVISNIIGPVFSSISFASLIHLCPEM